MAVNIKRIYEAPSPEDGYRVLVDRVWPRGVSKQKAALDGWLKQVAPSTKLRQWFNHEESKWREFEERYRAELDANSEVNELRQILADHAVVTLVYSARNEQENQAVALRDYLGH